MQAVFSTPDRIRLSPYKHTIRQLLSQESKAKKNYALNSQSQLLLQRRIILIRRQINPIEARMTLRQLARVSRLLNRKPSRSIRPLQILESIDRDT